MTRLLLCLLLCSGCTLTVIDETGRYHASVQRRSRIVRRAGELCPEGYTADSLPQYYLYWCEAKP